MREKIELMFKSNYFTVEIEFEYSIYAPSDAKCYFCGKKENAKYRSSVPYNSIEVISIKRSRMGVVVDIDSYKGISIVKEIKKLEKKVVCFNCCGCFSLIGHVLLDSYQSFK